MFLPLLSELARNISLLISLVFIQYLIQQKSGRFLLLKRLLQGILVGFISIILMNNSFEFKPGLIFDTRTILLSISGLYLGFLPSVIACAFAAIYRISLGGGGMITGVFTILFSGGIGLGARRFFLKDTSRWNWKENILFGLSVHLVVIVLFYFLLPRPQNVEIIRGTVLPYLLLYPVITALIGKILIYQIDVRNNTLQLMESRDLYKSLFQDNHSMMLLVDPESRKILDANKSALNFYGWTLSEIQNISLEQISVKSEQSIRNYINQISQNNLNHFLSVHRKADGSLVEVEVHSNIIRERNHTLMMAIVHDITDRVNTEKQLKKSEFQLSRAEIISSLGHWELNLNHKEFHASRGAINIYGVEDDHLDMAAVQSIPLPEDRPMMDKALNDLITRGVEYDLTFRIQRPCDGEIRDIHSLAEYNQSENIVFGIIHDITDYKKAQNSILQEKERLDVTLHSIGDGVITTDHKGCIQLLNPVAERLTGWSMAEAIGRPLPEVFTIVNEYTRKPCPNPVDLVFESGEIVELANHTMLLARNGRELIIADSGAPIKDKSGKIIGTVLVFRDTTEKQMLHNRMQRAERLESLGVLAGGIAHDFNNLLTGIFGYLEMARTYNGDPKVKSYLDSAFQVYSRTIDLTRQLLTFSKGNHPDRKTGDLLSLIRDSANFSLSGSSIICQLELEENLYPCSFDRNQIGQVLDNLLINAKQAMPEGGKIIVSARNMFLDNQTVLSLPAGNYICISVKDFGKGIPKDILPRIFDPFFTTKEMGSGLGLATCYSILEKHDGAIDVQSDTKGTVFRFFLPAVMARETEKPETKKRDFTSSGHILIMDDEDYVRQIVRFMLNSMNFSVMEAKDGEDLLAVLEDSEARGMTIDAAILDLTIPGGMGGLETMKNIRAKGYDFPVFASSGYSEDPVIALPEEYGFTDSITKPFQKEDLTTLLSRHFKQSQE